MNQKRADSEGGMTPPDAVATMPDQPTAEELAADVAGFAEPFPDIAGAELDGFLRRASGARVVLLGASTHGTSEFYELRSRLTRELIAHHGFDLVALEADWADAARIDARVRDRDVPASEWAAFSRFPGWQWRNEEMRQFVERLRDFNTSIGEPGERVAVHGLDLYGMHASIRAVLAFLEEVDPDAARDARVRYACLAPWEDQPGMYASSASAESGPGCEEEAVTQLRELLAHRLDYMSESDERFLDAVQNARVVADAERYYRRLYRGAGESWNLRERHMMDTLRILLAHRGPDARAVVWAHNVHAGDASATDMKSRGRVSLGQLCREEYEDEAYLVGLGTDRGTVAAAPRWEGSMQVMALGPARRDSYEEVLRATGLGRCLVPIRRQAPPAVRERLGDPRLERAIGAVYRPRAELENHYLRASLSRQFDEYVWLEETEAVTPLDAEETRGEPDTYPSGL